jgi:hypothetical protein
MIEIAIVVVIKDGVVSESFPFRGDNHSVSVAAESKFIELCEAHHGKPLDQDEKEAILEDGYMEIGEDTMQPFFAKNSSSICLHWLGSVTPVQEPTTYEGEKETFYATATISVQIECPKGADHDEIVAQINSEANYEISYIDHEEGISVLDTEFESLETS